MIKNLRTQYQVAERNTSGLWIRGYNDPFWNREKAEAEARKQNQYYVGMDRSFIVIERVISDWVESDGD